MGTLRHRAYHAKPVCIRTFPERYVYAVKTEHTTCQNAPWMSRGRVKESLSMTRSPLTRIFPGIENRHTRATEIVDIARDDHKRMY